jgi:hypothetical protein
MITCLPGRRCYRSGDFRPVGLTTEDHAPKNSKQAERKAFAQLTACLLLRYKPILDAVVMFCCAPLQLEKSKTQVDVIVIDHMNKQPTEN